MRCPNCELENPPEAARCDCGFDFSIGAVTPPLQAKAPAFPVGGLILIGFILVVVLANPSSARDSGETPVYWVFLLADVLLYLIMIGGRQNWARIVLSFLTLPLGLLVFNTRAARDYCRSPVPPGHPAYSGPRLKLHAVEADGLLGQAGLRAGDILYQYNGKPIGDDQEALLRDIERCQREGMTSKIRYVRDGREFLAEVPGGRLGVVLVNEG